MKFWWWIECLHIVIIGGGRPYYEKPKYLFEIFSCKTELEIIVWFWIDHIEQTPESVEVDPIATMNVHQPRWIQIAVPIHRTCSPKQYLPTFEPSAKLWAHFISVVSDPHWSHRGRLCRRQPNLWISTVSHHQDQNHYIRNRRPTRLPPNAEKIVSTARLLMRRSRYSR